MCVTNVRTKIKMLIANNIAANNCQLYLTDRITFLIANYSKNITLSMLEN